MSEETRLESIRESERKSHIEMYSNEELYKEGSWLSKPIKTVLLLQKHITRLLVTLIV